MGKAPDGYAFHTNNEPEAWWMVDLLQSYPVRHMRIHKRNGFETYLNADDISIFTSVDGRNWKYAGHPSAKSQYKPFVLSLKDSMIRFLRIEVYNKFLFLAQVEIIANENIIMFHGLQFLRSELISPLILNTILNGTYEHRECELCIANCSNNDIICEFGASLGLLSSRIIKSCKPKAYYAFEANPQLIHIIRDTYKRNDISCNIFNAAIGDSDIDCINFYVHKDCWASSLIKFKDYIKIEKVQMLSINSALAMSQANFLICDIEGGEFTAFNDAINLDHVNKICIEYHPVAGKKIFNIHTLLLNKGFRIITTPPPPPPPKKRYSQLHFM